MLETRLSLEALSTMYDIFAANRTRPASYFTEAGLGSDAHAPNHDTKEYEQSAADECGRVHRACLWLRCQGWGRPCRGGCAGECRRRQRKGSGGDKQGV